ncbi:hypothetical protein KR018_006431, partial [Drosophila ironensis]
TMAQSKQVNKKLIELFLTEETASTADTAFSEEDFSSITDESGICSAWPESKCRTCYEKLALDTNNRDIYAKKNSMLLYCIELIAGVRVEEGLPRQICDHCHVFLKRAIEFRRNCLKTEFKLKQIRKEVVKYDYQSSDEEIETELENVLYEECQQRTSKLSSGFFSDEDCNSDISIIEDAEAPLPLGESDVSLSDAQTFRKQKTKQRWPKHRCNEIADIFECKTKAEIGKIEGKGKVYKVVLAECNYEDSFRVEKKEKLRAKVPNYKPKLSLEEKNQRMRERARTLPLKYFCDKCEHSFRLKSHLKTHMLRHNQTKNFQCPECPKKFYDGYQCNIHVRVRHRGEKPFVCNHCSESFPSGSARHKHERDVHAAAPRIVMNRFNAKTNGPEARDGRYICNECPKSYTSKQSLKVHKNHHTGARPFKCQICELGFADPTLLRRHVETHNRLPFSCEICLKGFLLRCQLKEHMVVHTG